MCLWVSNKNFVPLIEVVNANLQESNVLSNKAGAKQQYVINWY